MTQYILQIFFAVLLFLSILEFTIEPEIRHPPKEDLVSFYYDSTLNYINSLHELDNYIISQAEKVGITSKNSIIDSGRFVRLVDKTIQNRFFNGKSMFQFGENSIAYLIGPLLNSELVFPVIPDDILKHNMALCEQHAIVFQLYLRKKGFKTRAVGLKKHYCSEVFYQSKPHFFDPNLEANFDSFDKVPSAEELFSKKTKLMQVYENLLKHKNIREPIQFMVGGLRYGEINQKLAPNAELFQRITSWISKFGFIPLGLLLIYQYFKGYRPVSIQQKNEWQNATHSNS